MASLGSPFPTRLKDIRSLLTSFSFTSDRWTSKLKTLWTLPVYLLLRLLAAYNRWSWQVCTMVNDGRYQNMSQSHQWLPVFYAMCCTIFDCMFSVSWQLPYLAAQIGTPYSGRTWKWWHIPQETLFFSAARLVAFIFVLHTGDTKSLKPLKVPNLFSIIQKIYHSRPFGCGNLTKYTLTSNLFSF